MSKPLKPLPHLQGAQSAASDPGVHASLSASAGTGKTQVLTARVLRLLLRGARPESILCLTFTKAAAAEMANRIGARLAAWVRLKDSELATELLSLGESNDPPTREKARQLFAQVLDCPGGLKIQTIHAFAQSLLAAFPAEAGIVPGFQPIEGRAEQELVRRTLADLMADAESQGNEPLIADVQLLSRRLGESGAVDYLQACARRPEAMQAVGPGETIEARIRELMSLPEGDPERIVLEACADDQFDCGLLRRLLEANRQWDTDSGRAICANIERWLAGAPEARVGELERLASKLVTKDFRPYKVSPKQVAVCSDYEELVQNLAAVLKSIHGLRNGLRLAGEMAAGLRAGQAFAAAYGAAKRAAGVADFNDLIEWTRDLLAKPGMGEWVRYKLDRQVDHVLVDEAQDTNEAQWDIIARLVEEYFSGSSESEGRLRTLFMVGDLKQAIYGFQGSEPERFHEMRSKFRGLAEALTGEDAAIEFRDLSIAASFRSAQPVLDVVDAMIGVVGPEALALREAPPRHLAHHGDRTGEVELWQPFAVENAADDSEEGEERWISLRDRYYADSLAERIHLMIEQAPVLSSTGRPLSAGDILVLVRSRGELASLLVARLFSAEVPVAGVDRLHLHEPLAVQDLLAAVKFAVQPADDLSLACLLVSPMIGWDQEQLRELAYPRKGTIWRELRRRAGDGEPFQSAHDALAELLGMADFTTPARFLETILSGPMQGRRKLYGRLGLAARDAIDELVNSAIEFERSETASLDRYLAWFSRGTVDVQRDPGAPGDEVRVMTVHGAKGLEAPVVIVADATGDPAKLGRTPVTLDFQFEGAGKAPLLRPRKDERCPPFEQQILDEEARDLEEHMRLLYVAMTRAADRLIVSGVRPQEKKDGSDPRPPNSWHRIVEQAMVEVSAEPVDQGKWGVALRYGSRGTARERNPRESAEQPSAAIPDWALRAAPVEERPSRPLAPSAIAADDAAALPPSEAMRAAARRGTLIHSLLERLPPVPEVERRGIALGWLERSAGVVEPHEREEIAATVCRILSDPALSGLFAPGSMGEAPLAATLPDGRVIAGTVDRLLVEPNEVSVIDFKTGRVPADAVSIPRSHVAQMEAYSEALSVIFPGRAIRTVLLYTAGPTLFEL